MLELELGTDPYPALTTASPTAGGVTRSRDFVQEVANARVWEGVHYRNSAIVGTEMGLVAEQVVSTSPTQ